MKVLILLTIISACFAAPFNTGFKTEDGAGSFQYGFNVGHSPGAAFKSADPFSGVRVVSYHADDKGFHSQVKAGEGSFIPKDPSEITIKNARLVEVAPVKYTIKHSPAVHYYAGIPFVDGSKTEEVKKIEHIGESPVAPKISFYSGDFPGSIHDKINHPKPIFFAGGFPSIKKFDEPSKIIPYSSGFSFIPQMHFKEEPKIQFFSSGGESPVIHQGKVEDHKVVEIVQKAPIHHGEHEIKKIDENVDKVVSYAGGFPMSIHHGIHSGIKPGAHFFSSGVPVIHEVKEIVDDKITKPIETIVKVDDHIKKFPVISYSSGFPGFDVKQHSSFSKIPFHSSGWAVKPIEVKPVEIIPYSSGGFSGGYFQKESDFPIKKYDEKFQIVPVSYSSGWPFTSTFQQKSVPSFGGGFAKWF